MDLKGKCWAGEGQGSLCGKGLLGTLVGGTSCVFGMGMSTQGLRLPEERTGSAGTLHTDHYEGMGWASWGQPKTPWWSAHNAVKLQRHYVTCSDCIPTDCVINLQNTDRGEMGY